MYVEQACSNNALVFPDPATANAVEYLDSYRPSLKADMENLTSLLLLVKDQCLPDRRLELEMLTESQIASGELATRSLEELFKYSDNYSSFLTEIARSDHSPPITEASPDSIWELTWSLFFSSIHFLQGSFFSVRHPHRQSSRPSTVFKVEAFI